MDDRDVPTCPQLSLEELLKHYMKVECNGSDEKNLLIDRIKKNLRTVLCDMIVLNKLEGR